MEPLIKANKCDEVYKTLLPIVQTELPSTLNTARLYKQFPNRSSYYERLSY